MRYFIRRVFYIMVVIVFIINSINYAFAWTIEEASKPFAGRRIKISLMMGYEINKILLSKLIPEFKKNTGVRVDVEYITYQDVIPFHKHILEENNSDYDLLNVDDPRRPPKSGQSWPLQNRPLGQLKF